MLVHQPWGSWFEYALPDIAGLRRLADRDHPGGLWHDYGQVASRAPNGGRSSTAGDVRTRSSPPTRLGLLPILERMIPDGARSTRTTTARSSSASRLVTERRRSTSPERAAIRIAASRLPHPELAVDPRRGAWSPSARGRRADRRSRARSVPPRPPPGPRVRGP